MLHPPDDWLDGAKLAEPEAADYYYQGYCPRTGQHYRLPRTARARAIAQALMTQLGDTHPTEGKMYGVLVVQTPDGQTGVLKAFSGLWQGQEQVPGWVPPIPGRSQVALQEARTLNALGIIKDRLLVLQRLPERETYARLQEELAGDRTRLNQRHRDRKQARALRRQTLASTLTGDALTDALAALEQESRGDKAELRKFKQRWRDRLAPLEATLQSADAQIAILRQQRRNLSRQLQAEMHAAYTLTNFAGESLAIQDLAAQGNLPTGTGDCCAPKLLRAAAQLGLKPLAMAEFWWGSAQGDRIPGEFYGACADRCQPIMGFLLSGLSAQVLGSATIPVGAQHAAPLQPPPTGDLQPELGIPVLYQDPWLIAVDKPAGLLSVPGRYRDRQDSVLTRLRSTLPEGAFLQPVHRLDQDTSGLLLLALDAETHRHLSQQFEQRQVQKTYQAIVVGDVAESSGIIDLPLWGDPTQRPRQQVNSQHGKPSQTKFEVLGREGGLTRIAFYPLTGRTHQIRVHAAQGLNAPIWGDRLYGQSEPGQRLHLHAQSLHFVHPHKKDAIPLGIASRIALDSAVPF
ncbi:pseudouridine synthase [Leptolyngbya sp. CCNP1308]|uniref:RluA family pseudouridine synthase n=1 Tax=Leptolyngbya sp. CCNP1308 TaxID=3110255 RepID=UPI002B203A49|nr:pseudouridine synthase [Leptolyngbya sp. CCNP1308]MEA5452194.1 pseudouridine synthase [Leptolyngbya sp. CCNP1308]